MTHYKALVLLLAMCFAAKAPAQDTRLDSLLRILPQARDTVKVNVLNQISKRYWYADPVKTLHFARLALKSAKDLGFSKGTALAYNNLGIGHYLQNDYPNALKYLRESIWSNQQQGNTKGVGDAYNNMGLISIKQSNYPEALEFYLLSLKAYEDRNDLSGSAGILSNIGNLYDDIQDYKTALEYYFKALKILEKDPADDDELAQLMNNIGSVYLNTNQYSNALKFLQKSLDRRSDADQQGRGITFSNIGLAHMEMNNYPKAIDHFSKALSVQQRLDDDFHMMATLEGLAQTHLLTGDLVKSELFARECLGIANKIGNRKRAATAYKILAEISVKQNRPRDAYDNELRYSELRDSTLNEVNTMKIARLQIGYQTQKKEAEIELLKKENSLSNMIRNLLALGLVSCLIIAGLIFSRQRLKMKDQKILAEKEREISVTQRALSEARIEAAQLTAHQMQTELETRSKALTTHTLNLIQKNGIMEEIRETVSLALKSSQREVSSPLLSRLIRLIDYSFNLDNDWEEFKLYFEQVHKDFFVRLKQDHPDLSPNEMRLCALIRLNMNLKECATLLSVSSDSIKTARHRLKKKLGLAEEQSLVDYFITI